MAPPTPPCNLGITGRRPARPRTALMRYMLADAGARDMASLFAISWSDAMVPCSWCNSLAIKRTSCLFAARMSITDAKEEENATERKIPQCKEEELSRYHLTARGVHDFEIFQLAIPGRGLPVNHEGRYHHQRKQRKRYQRFA